MPDSRDHPILRWCEQQRAMHKDQLARLESGIIHVGERRADGTLVDTTPDMIEHVKGVIAEMDRLLAENGYANRT